MSEQKQTLREWVEQREAAWLRRIETEHGYRHMPEYSIESDILTVLDHALKLHDVEVEALKKERDAALALSEKRMFGVIQGWVKQGELSCALTRARAAFCACNQERRRLRDREIARLLRLAEVIREAHAPKKG